MLALFAPLLLQNVGGLISGAIYLLFAVLIVIIICYIVTRLIEQFFSGASSFSWVIWAIGGLILLLIAWNIFSPGI